MLLAIVEGVVDEFPDDNQGPILDIVAGLRRQVLHAGEVGLARGAKNRTDKSVVGHGSSGLTFLSAARPMQCRAALFEGW